ncbi:DedA family protein [Tomitella gaofuii]|uniref:DedA family protein n=1 Tax=Tomitella gaofuii TaxID=2760083 RepID=UPI0015FA4F41|nr:DedA family protein [Tomitella gaofuii]
MTEVFEQLLTLNGAVVYAIVGALVFAEVALLVGFVVPGETAAIVGGVLASLGHAELWPMAAVVIGSAVLGDLTGFGVGHLLGDRMAGRPMSPRRRRRREQTQALIARRGPLAVFVGRYIAFVRTLMPTLAGASGMRLRPFLLADVAAALTWGAANVAIGYVVGRSYKEVVRWLGAGSAVVLTVVVIAAAAVWLLRRRRRAAGAGTARAPVDSPESSCDH